VRTVLVRFSVLPGASLMDEGGELRALVDGTA
jgi:hypothetical protein